MKHRFYLGLALAVMGSLVPAHVRAQSDSGVPLGDLARSLRANKQPAAPPVVIDNDNLSQVMDQVENLRLNGRPLFSMEGSNNNFQMSSPDGTCSLSFNANATSLLTTPYVAEDLPQSELAKLEGPANIDGDTLQISMYNGTGWSLKEITIGLTITRRREDTATNFATARLLPATATENPTLAGKPADLTLLLHLKGSAAPLATTIFREKLGATLAPDQEWHWAIVQAKGIPPSPLSVPAGF